MYYNHVLATLSNEIESTLSQGQMVYQDVSPFTILRHLRDSVEQEYCSPKLIAQVLQQAKNILVKQYEPLYENLKIKEAFLVRTYGQPLQNTSSSIDENETLVDQITHFREGLNLYLDLTA